jgi:SAM-dependent methyltransferase
VAEVPGNAGYAEQAEMLGPRYERRSFEDIHQSILHLLPDPPANVLDIGAGTGRDAAALSRRGYRVTAVEPTDELRLFGMRQHAEDDIEWIDDGLPDLVLLTGRDRAFDLVMMTAVLMHLDADARRTAIETVAGLLRPAGLVILMLRHGPVPDGRTMYDVRGSGVVELGRTLGLSLVFEGASQSTDPQGRGIDWTRLALRRNGAA